MSRWARITSSGPEIHSSIDLWGGLTEQITRTIASDGRILLPEAGSIELAGLTLGKAQSLIEARLTPQYRNAQVAVTVSRLRSVRVYVVGDAQRPGGYDISALGTPLSALYAAGGPTAVGSLRTLLHYRGKQLVEKVDLYDFLLHGIRNGSAPFESGDTLLVPPAGSEIAIYGTVRRPAIYELTAGEATLASVIDDAGGVTAAASFSHIRIERIDANQQRVTITLPDHGGQNVQASRDAINAFRVKDGDRIQSSPFFRIARVLFISRATSFALDGCPTRRACASAMCFAVIRISCPNHLSAERLYVLFLRIFMRKPSTLTSPTS